MDAKQVDVMVADASHEVYVDKILDTIREAAKQYVATSGLIVHPNYRGIGLAKRIKAASFRLARLRWPKAKIFSLTSGAAVMIMNTELGYVPVTFNELTDDEAFWKGCEGCINHDILVAKNRKFCICTAMLYDPALHEEDTI